MKEFFLFTAHIAFATSASQGCFDRDELSRLTAEDLHQTYISNAALASHCINMH